MLRESRVKELTRDSAKEKKLRDALQSDLEEQSKQNEIFRKVINKFMRSDSIPCANLVKIETGKINVSSFCMIHRKSGIILFMGKLPPLNTLQSALEDEVRTLRKYVDNFQRKLSVGLEIETHLKKRVNDLEKKRTLLEEAIQKSLSQLLYCYSQHKEHIRNSLCEEYSYVKSIVDVIGEKLQQLDNSKEQIWKSSPKDMIVDER